MGIFPKGWGEYPVEYNREIHGPYNPSVYYGKRDTPFPEVKLGDLFAWFGRRKKTPRAMAQALSRWRFRYLDTWVFTRKSSPTFIYQSYAALSLISYILCYVDIKKERSYRYH